MLFNKSLTSIKSYPGADEVNDRALLSNWSSWLISWAVNSKLNTCSTEYHTILSFRDQCLLTHV